MLESIESVVKRLKVCSAMLFVMLVAILNLSACGGSDGDDEFKAAVQLNDLNITSIEVISENHTVEIGVIETYQAIGNIGKGDKTKNITRLVHWSSSDSSKVKINASGVATTLAEGMVEIRAELADLSDSKDLIASAALLNSIDIERVGLPATVGVCSNGYQMIAHGNYGVEPEPRIITNIVDWASEDTSVATVTDEGQVSALKGGSVIFTASRINTEGTPITGESDLTVDRDLLTSIVVTPDTDVSVFIGSSRQFKAIGTYSDMPGELHDITDTVDWDASNSDESTTGEHLEISASGLASGVSQGQSDITASCAGDPSAMPDPIDPAATSNVVTVSIEVPVTLDDIEINDGVEFVKVDLEDSSVQLEAKLVYFGSTTTKNVTDDSDTTWEVESGSATLSDASGDEGEVFFTAIGTSVINVFYSDDDGNNVRDEISVVVE